MGAGQICVSCVGLTRCWVHCWVVVALTLGCVLAGGCRKPTSGGNDAPLHTEAFYDQVRSIQQRVWGDGPNGWPAFENILDMHDAILQAEADKATGEGNTATPAAIIDDLVYGPYPREGLAAGLGVFDQLEQAGFFTQFNRVCANDSAIVQPWDTSKPVLDSFSQRLVVQGRIRSLCRTLQSHSRVLAHAGDDAGVVRDVTLQLRSAKAAASGLVAIEYLSGMALTTRMLSELNHLALEEAMSAEMIKGVLNVLDDEPLLVPIDAVLETQHAYDLAMVPDDDQADRSEQAAHRRAYAQAVDAAYAWASEQAGNATRGPIATIDDDTYFSLMLADHLDPKQQLSVMHHIYASVIDNDRRLGFDLAGTRAVLLVALYKAEHGIYPASLDQVGAPVDPISGMPFVYTITPQDSAMPFLIYSVGVDHVDNHGVEKEATMLSPPGPDDVGFDCCITHPRGTEDRR